MGLGAAGSIAAVGAVVSAAGTVMAAQSASANAKYQAQVANNNATIAQQNSQYAIKASEAQAANQGQAGRASLARIRTAQAASGIDVNSGSAVDVQTSQAETNQQNTANTLNNGLLQAYGYRTQATNFSAQAGLDSAESGQDETAGEIGAAGSLLSSASSIGGKFGSSPTDNSGFGATNAIGSDGVALQTNNGFSVGPV